MSSSEPLPPQLSGDVPGPDSPLPAIMYRLTRRRRLVLELLLDAASPVRERELSKRVAASEAGSPPSSIDDGTADAVHVDLQQVDLPALEDVDLVDRTGGAVTTSDHPVFDEHWFQRLVRADADLDTLVECLASERRLAVLDALGDEAITRSELAERVAANESSSASAEDVEISLHHGHLPKLEDTGLLERREPGADAEPTFHRTCSTVEEAWLQFLAGS